MGQAKAWPSEHLQRRCLDPLTQNRVQAAPRHDVGLAPKDSGGSVLHIHQLEKSKRPQRVIEKEIDVGILAGLAARGRAEKVKVLDAELLELGLMLLQFGYGVVAIDACTITQFRDGLSLFRLGWAGREMLV